jgi:hypothetical protein
VHLGSLIFSGHRYAPSLTKVVPSLMSRTAAQQLAHWARIGREIEAGESVSRRSIAAALSGTVPYDELTSNELAVVHTLQVNSTSFDGLSRTANLVCAWYRPRWVWNCRHQDPKPDRC